MYTVSSVRTFMGREGVGYNANLKRDGKIVASIIDDASGGPIIIQWRDVTRPKVPCELFNGINDATPSHNVTPEEKLLWDHVRPFPMLKTQYGEMRLDPDLFIDELVNAHH